MNMKERYAQRHAERAAREREEAKATKAPARRRRTTTRVSVVASREEQHGRYLDCGPAAWDDRESPSGDY